MHARTQVPPCDAVRVALTDHARARMQQRGIAPAVLEALLAHGRRRHDRRGGALVFFDKAARERLERAGLVRELPGRDRVFCAYAVLDAAGAAVLTVGHRCRRMRRP